MVLAEAWHEHVQCYIKQDITTSTLGPGTYIMVLSGKLSTIMCNCSNLSPQCSDEFRRYVLYIGIATTIICYAPPRFAIICLGVSVWHLLILVRFCLFCIVVACVLYNSTTKERKLINHLNADVLTPSRHQGSCYAWDKGILSRI